jgi:hypothetical protein
MRIGILSDTHGRLPTAKAAMELLVAAGCEMFIHCGDVGSRDILDLLAGLNSSFVFGNTDYDRDALAGYAETISVRCLQTGGTILCDGKKLAVTHGDEPDMLQELLAKNPDYLFTGHTHVAKDIQQGKTRWINPGALQRAPVKSVAVLDLANDRLEFLKV